jgi:hypothetical protein
MGQSFTSSNYRTNEPYILLKSTISVLGVILFGHNTNALTGNNLWKIIIIRHLNGADKQNKFKNSAKQMLTQQGKICFMTMSGGQALRWHTYIHTCE